MNRLLALAFTATLVLGFAPAASATPTCFGQPATIIGTDGPDDMWHESLSPGPDVIVGLGGDDAIYAGDGDDLVCGGSGNDTVFGGNHNDRVHGDDGNDEVNGGYGGRDQLYGGIGQDWLEDNSPDVDEFNGGKGADIIRSWYSGSEQDRVNGAGGTDTCRVDRPDTRKNCEKVVVA